MNTKLHAICDSQGRPPNLVVTAGQVSDDIGARALLSSLPEVGWLLGDCGYGANPSADTVPLIGYETVLKQGDFFLYFRNSMIVTRPTDLDLAIWSHDRLDPGLHRSRACPWRSSSSANS